MRYGSEATLALVGGDPWRLSHSDTCAINGAAGWPRPADYVLPDCSCGLDQLRKDFDTKNGVVCQFRNEFSDIRCTLPRGHEGKHKPGRCCPVPGCDLPRKQNHMMCLTHWRRVPKVSRDRVWGAMNKDMDEYMEARAEAIGQAHLWQPRRGANARTKA